MALLIPGPRPVGLGPPHYYTKFINILKETMKIHIIEVGYTGDLTFIQKKEETQEQHKNLVSLLRGEGWKIDQKNTLP